MSSLYSLSLFSQSPPPSCTDPFAPPALDPDDIPLWPYILAKTLIALYSLICVLSLTSLAKIVCHHHKLLSFRAFFLALSLIWTLLRIAFFLSSPSSSSCTPSATLSDATRPSSPLYHFFIDLLYYLPSSCQLAMFSLLLLFYAKLYHQHLHTWKFVERKCCLLFASLNSLQLSSTVTFIVLIQQPTSSTALEWYHQSYFILTSVFFLTLFLIACYYFHLLHRHTHITSVLSSHHLSLSSVIFLLLLSRCIFDGGAALDSSAILFRRQLFETNAGILIELPTFLLLFLWEIVPTGLVILFFRDTPPPGGGIGGGGWGCGGWLAKRFPSLFSPAPFSSFTPSGRSMASLGVEREEVDEDEESVDGYFYDGIEEGEDEEGKRRREREEEERRADEEKFKHLSVFSPYSASLFLPQSSPTPLYAQGGGYAGYASCITVEEEGDGGKTARGGRVQGTAGNGFDHH